MHCALRSAGRQAGCVGAGALYAGQMWLSASAGYLLLLLAAGRKTLPATAPVAGPTLRVVVLVPAHDEENTVSLAVDALRRQDYPPDLLDVVVIADNCSDTTASTAGAAGAIVWERQAPDAPGKGRALTWALERLWRELPASDIVLVVDADCMASPNLCSTVVATMVASGADAVQVPYEVSNAEESPAAALRAAGFALKHIIRARGRARLGLSCGLFGTGMGFSASLLHSVPWSTSVTEDTELFVRLTRAGYRVAYAEGARVFSPMPASADEASDQQLRWESGNAELARRELPGLLWQALRTRDLQCLGAAAELALPAQSLLSGGALGLLAAGLVIRKRRLAAAAAATIAAQGCYVLAGLASVGGSGLRHDALAHVPAFAAGRLRVLGRVASGRGAETWVRTTRPEETREYAAR